MFGDSRRTIAEEGADGALGNSAAYAFWARTLSSELGSGLLNEFEITDPMFAAGRRQTAMITIHRMRERHGCRTMVRPSQPKGERSPDLPPRGAES
jgi:hypothetical protein